MAEITVSYKIKSPFPDWVTPAVLAALHREGHTLRDIAERFKGEGYPVSRETVRNWIKKAEAFKRSSTSSITL